MATYTDPLVTAIARFGGAALSRKDAQDEQRKAEAAQNRLLARQEEQDRRAAEMNQLDRQLKLLQADALLRPKPQAPPPYIPRGAAVPDGQGGYIIPSPVEIPEKAPPKPTAWQYDAVRGLQIHPETGQTRRVAPERPTGREGTPRLPSSMIEKLGAYDAIEGMAGDVKAALEEATRKGVNVTGRLGGVIKTPTWAKNFVGMGGQTGTDVRALIGNLYATIAKERGGTALSANEIRLLESYLPNENEDEGQAILKANRFLREIRRLKEAKIAALQKYGKFAFDDAMDAREDAPARNPYLPPDDGR